MPDMELCLARGWRSQWLAADHVADCSITYNIMHTNSTHSSWGTFLGMNFILRAFPESPRGTIRWRAARHFQEEHVIDTFVDVKHLRRESGVASHAGSRSLCEVFKSVPKLSDNRIPNFQFPNHSSLSDASADGGVMLLVS